jgi:lipoprotein-anchoring transpeptidase ErfK/SrfK
MEIDGTINENPDEKKGIDKNSPDQNLPDPVKVNELINSDQKIPTPESIADVIVPGEDKTDNEEVTGQSELVQLLLSYWNKIYFNTVLRKIIRNTLYLTLLITAVLFFFSWFIYITPGLQESGRVKIIKAPGNPELKNDPGYKKQMVQMGRDAQRVSRKFAAYTPGQSYLVINTTDNRYFLYQNKKLIREGFCSTGSFIKLTSSEGTRHWIFKTPKGRFWIQQKITKPLWIRPDWSFVEEGLPIPPANDESRYEYGVLGDYAMSLGDGYLIHGTLYKYFLGMPVTHGCVRLDDPDLEAIYNTLNIGSKVFIF